MNEFDMIEIENLEDVDELLSMILPKGGKKQLCSSPEGKKEAVRLLAGFVEASLFNMGWLLNDFAEELDVEPEFAKAILLGILDESEFTDELLSKIAGVIEYHPNILRIMLGRDIKPQTSAQATNEDLYLLEEKLLLLKGEVETFLSLLDRIHKTGVRDELEVTKDSLTRCMRALIGRLESNSSPASIPRWDKKPEQRVLARILFAVGRK